MTMLDQAARRMSSALWYAHRGWPVVPIHGVDDHGCTCGKPGCSSPGKHPLAKHGVSDATVDASVIQGWWQTWVGANVGIATGAPGPVVLDIDPRHGGDEALEDLQSKHGRLPDTVECLTGGGGRHIYFCAPPQPVRNSAGQLGPGLDVRGVGGYVVAPPSLHSCGRSYEWECSSRPNEVDLAPVPGWLMTLICPELAGPPAARPASEWQRLASTDAPEGERNSRLAQLTGLLLRRHVEPHVVVELVMGWNRGRCKPPLSDAEVVAVVESIAARELRRRRAREVQP